jgi:hypothetical protein
MDKVHTSTPEPIVFLKLAGRSMENYFLQHQKYPNVWAEVDMTFVNGPYRLTDPDIRPPADSGYTWRPRNSGYVYRLTTNSSRSNFRIDAVAPDGQTKFFIESGQSTPSAAVASPAH